MEKEDSVFVNHIFDSINAIETFSKGISRKDLKKNRLVQSAIVREIEVIGESARNISESFKKKHSEILWKDIIRTRDKMIHHYFGIDLDIVWNIIKFDLQSLKKKLSD